MGCATAGSAASLSRTRESPVRDRLTGGPFVSTELPVRVPIDVLDQFERATDHWSPKVIARVNDQYVKVTRLLGEMDWHSHADEDELFWVLRGRLRLEFRDGAAELTTGQ